MLSWDLSPLRPWEYWEQDAAEWTEAVTTKSAFNAGMAEYRNSKNAAEARKKRDAERLVKLKQGNRG